MVLLNDRKWKEFFVGDIANIESGSNISSDAREKGKIPYITASFNNNGVTDFISNRESVDRNFISVNSNGSIGYSFYHKYKSICSNDCRKLNLKTSNNEYVSLFITNQISCQRDKYNYGYKMGTKRLQRQYIMLPVTDEGEPDWNFMENYIKQIETKQKENYKDFAIQKLKNLEYKEIPKLNEKTWKASEIENFFKIYTGGDMIISKLNPGNIPLITHSLSENGVTKYIEEQGSNIKKFNCNMTISLADRGNFGAFVQMIDFYIGTRVKALEFKICDISINKEILMFFSNCINAQATKFNYGNNCCANIGKLKIMLPIKQDETPDYEYMEQYIKNVMYKQLHTYLKTRG